MSNHIAKWKATELDGTTFHVCSNSNNGNGTMLSNGNNNTDHNPKIGSEPMASTMSYSNSDNGGGGNSNDHGEVVISRPAAFLNNNNNNNESIIRGQLQEQQRQQQQQQQPQVYQFGIKSEQDPKGFVKISPHVYSNDLEACIDQVVRAFIGTRQKLHDNGVKVLTPND